MPEWIHERARHISAKNPSMPESQAWAIATQQSHALGKSPKGYGTKEGRTEAKAKYDSPKDDKKTANPGNLESKKVAGWLSDTIEGAKSLLKTTPKAAPTTGQLLASGVRKQMAAGRNFGGAAVDPFLKMRKAAGIAVQYDMDGNPKHAETSDDWLVSHFKNTGTFMVPNRLAASEVAFQQSKYAEVRREAFLNELGRIALQELMHKEALDPRLTHSLVGAGIGAGVGGAAGYVGTKAMEGLPTGDDDESHAGRNAVIGALLGGAGGAGLGYLSGRELHELRQRADAAGKDYVANAGAGKFLPDWEPPPRPRPVVKDFTPIPLGEATDAGMARTHEVHGAQQALQQVMAASPQALPGTNDPEKIYGAIQRIQKLDPLTVRARTGANPGYLARKGIEARHGIATKFDLGPEETEMALRGKLGSAISQEEAEGSLRRYQKLQDQKPTAGQVGRYAALGAAAAPVAGVLKNVITGGGASWSGAKEKALEGAVGLRRAGLHGRALAGMAAAGALTSGALPLVRAHLDQQAEKAKLREYLSQQSQQLHLPDGDGGELKMAGVGPEAGFSGTGYGDTGGRVDFHMVSSLNAPPTQSLQDKPFASPGGGRVGGGPIMVPTVKTAGPLGQLSASAKIGKTPAALADNNSIASVAKPKGFGQVAVGAKQPVLH